MTKQEKSARYHDLHYRLGERIEQLATRREDLAYRWARLACPIRKGDVLVSPEPEHRGCLYRVSWTDVCDVPEEGSYWRIRGYLIADHDETFSHYHIETLLPMQATNEGWGCWNPKQIILQPAPPNRGMPPGHRRRKARANGHHTNTTGDHSGDGHNGDEMSDRVYIGQGKRFTTQYGENFEIELTVNDMKRAIEEARQRAWSKTFTRKDRDTGALIEEEVVKITLWEKREPGPWATHYGELKSANRDGGDGNAATTHTERQAAPVVTRAADAVSNEDDGLPF